MNKDIKAPQLRGVDIDAADDCKVDAELVWYSISVTNPNSDKT